MPYIDEFIEDEGLCVKDNQICSNAGRQLSVPVLYSKFKKGVEFSEDFLNQKDFKKSVKDNAPDRTKKNGVPVFPLETVDTEHQLVDQAIKTMGIKLSATGEEVTMNNRTIPASKLESLIAGHVVSYNNQSQILTEGKMTKFRRTFTQSDIKSIYQSQITLRELENRNKLAESVAYDEKYKDYAHNVLTAIFKMMRPPGDTEWDVDFHVTMVKQWMWQVKQHISPEFVGDLKVKTVLDHYLINISSDSGDGAGKTTFIRKLCSPVADYYHEGTLENVASQSDYAVFSSNYIVLFDELSFGRIPASERGKVMTTLKYVLTAEKMFNRVYHTQTFQRMARQFSGISTSNGSLTNMIYDPTGMRRFYEIKVNPNRNVKRFKQINDMDALKVWKGINENDRKGFIKTDSDEFKKLQKIQKGYIKKDAIDIYLDTVLEEGMNEMNLFTIAEATQGGFIKRFDEIHGTEKQETMADKVGIEVLSIQDFRENLLSFYESDMDEKRWLQKREALRDALKSKGYWVITHNNAILIPTKREEAP